MAGTRFPDFFEQRLRRLAVVTVALAASSCALQPVTVKRVERFEIANMLTRPTIQCDVVVVNPNRVGLTLEAFEADIALEGATAGHVSTAPGIRIPAGAEARIPVETAPDLRNLPALIGAGKAARNGRCEGRLTVRKFLFKKKFSFAEDFRL